jgi:ferrochelatase
MYPQYSATTTASVFEHVTAELARWRWIPELRTVNQYWQENAYVAAVTDSIAAHWREHGRKHLLFSFHSIPKRYFAAGDPYHCFCQATARLVAERIGLASGDWSIGFQSRFGREEWLKPYVDHLLHEYAHSDTKKVTVVCPGFATDCLETLEEIDIRYRAAFLEQGGEAFDCVPCLNASDAQVALYEQLVAKHTHGWPEFADGGDAATADDAARRAESRERALAQGARS